MASACTRLGVYDAVEDGHRLNLRCGTRVAAVYGVDLVDEVVVLLPEVIARDTGSSSRRKGVSIHVHVKDTQWRLAQHTLTHKWGADRAGQSEVPGRHLKPDVVRNRQVANRERCYQGGGCAIDVDDHGPEAGASPEAPHALEQGVMTRLLNLVREFRLHGGFVLLGLLRTLEAVSFIAVCIEAVGRVSVLRWEAEACALALLVGEPRLHRAPAGAQGCAHL